MTTIIARCALAAFLVAGCAPAAQQMRHPDQHASQMAAPGHMMMMKTKCPLHLKTLGLSAEQQAAMDSVRATRKAAMKAQLAGIDARGGEATDADRAEMERDMKSAVASARAILTDSQRVVFDAAVAQHAAEMARHKAEGTHDCLTCCRECDMHAGHAMKGGEGHEGH